jgi:hypothetical protein
VNQLICAFFGIFKPWRKHHYFCTFVLRVFRGIGLVFKTHFGERENRKEVFGEGRDVIGGIGRKERVTNPLISISSALKRSRRSYVWRPKK